MPEPNKAVKHSKKNNKPHMGNNGPKMKQTKCVTMQSNQ
jgi:hypothetical protein